MKSVVILGAGISGLTAAWYLKKRYGPSIELIILEKSDRAGGWIRTLRDKDFLFELGPRSCRPKGNGKFTLELIEELGLEKEVITGDPQAHKRYLFWNGRLHCLPHGFISFLTSPLTKGILRAFFQDLRTPKNRAGDESIYDFIHRRFGSALAERFVDPLVSGIYAGDIRRLSVRSCFPMLVEAEETYGSVLKGLFLKKKSSPASSSPLIAKMEKEPLFSFKDGMETLTQSLASRLQPHIRYGCQIEKIIPQPDGLQIRMHDQTTLHADRLYSCIPASALGEMLSEESSALSAHLSKITSASVVTINLGYRRPVLKHRGFGHLIPHSEKNDILGVVWDSSVFPGQNRSAQETRLTVMMGGTVRQDLMDLNDEKLEEIALAGVADQLGIHERPDSIVLTKAKEAIPQYLVNYKERLDRINRLAQEFSPSLTLLGNSFHGVAVNDCVAHARQTIEKLR